MHLTPLEIAVALIGVVVAILMVRQMARLAVRGGVAAWTRLPPAVASSRAWARLTTLGGRVEAKAPALARFVRARSSPRLFTGLPLTLLTAGALYTALLFGGLLEEVVEAEGVVRLDQTVNMALAPLRTPQTVALFLWITELGDSATVVAVGIAATAFLVVQRRLVYIAPLWVTTTGAQLTTWLGKMALNRQRPEFLTIATATSPSFPSGHATSAMAIYGFLAYVLTRESCGPRERFEIVFWSMLVVALVGFSRIFLSVHYTSDVAAGFLVGSFWLLVGFTATELARARSLAQARQLP